MKLPKQQQGMTAIGWLIVLGLIAFFALIGIRLLPLYLESFKVAGALDSMKQEPFVTKKDKGEIMRMLSRRFEIDDIDSVDLRKNVEISKDAGILKIRADWERRTHLLGNVDVVLHFDKNVEIVER
jgi:hypothetical protein